MDLTMELPALLASIGDEVEDAEQESFLAFSQPIASQNLGFIDSRSNTVEVSIREREFTVHQSPTVLASRRAGGTTGAVLWKVSPLLAEWLCTKENILWTSSFLNKDSTVVELGCGVAGLLALSLAPYVGQYIATDQEYVQKVFKDNLAVNLTAAPTARSHSAKAKNGHGNQQRRRQQQSQKHNQSNNNKAPEQSTGNITFVPLDWELDSPCTLKQSITSPNTHSSNANSGRSTPRSQSTSINQQEETAVDLGFDLLLGCDCIYNDALISPFTRTCAEICRFRPGLASSGLESGTRPTICIIAQQLRTHEVFENWLLETLVDFRVWRVKDEVLGREMSAGSGFVVHVLVLRAE